MRTRRLFAIAVPMALVVILSSVTHVAAAKQTRGLDGQVRSLDFSKSVPGQLNYQGYLADAADSSRINSTLEMTFRLFDSQTKGAEQWAETHPAVEVSDGLFQILLGSVTAFPSGLFDGTELWLQTEVGTEILSPRKSLVSVAYSQQSGDADHASTADWAAEAQHAVNADTAAYSPSTNVWLVSGDDIYRETGKVGIGTASPLTEFDVSGSVNASTYYGDGSNLTGISGTTDNDWTIDGADVYHETGNVGIGKTSPAARLDVNGDINSDSLYKISGSTVLSANGVQNIFVGSGAGENNSGGQGTFVGYRAGVKNQGPANTFIGCSAGDSNATGWGNTFVGYKAGLSNTTGEQNTFLGISSGQSNTSGKWNTFVGYTAGIANNDGGWNVFVGGRAGISNTSGDFNLFAGNEAGFHNTAGSSNTFLGYTAGFKNEAGAYNTFLGMNTGQQNVTGDDNAFLGQGAGYANVDGSSNTYIGKGAGAFNTTGSHNVFLGHDAGYHETGSQKLYIANGADTSDVLIYGDFSTRRIGMGTLSPDAKLEVQGPPNDLALIKIDQTGTNQYAGLRLDRDDTEKWFMGMSSTNDNLTFRRTASSNYMVIDTTGKVGIGMQTPSYKLDVAGDINTTGEIRKNGTLYNHPDYVFEPDYEMMSLPQLRDFVTQNKHLPSMPSAEEVKDDGVKLFEHNRLMLEKLEEAYLYILALEERITQLEDSQKQ